MSKMKQVWEIANDPIATEELFTATELAEQTNKPFFNYQGKQLQTPVAKAMVILIQDHINYQNSL